MNIYNFDECPYSNRHGRYGGMAGDKDGILINNEPYIIKYPKNTKGMAGNVASYTTSPLSEYIGSHIYEILGFNVHETYLGIRNNKIVVACKDFQKNFGDLAEVRTLKNAANKEISEYMGENIPLSLSGDRVNLNEIEIHLKINPLLNSPEINKRFWEQVVIDILIDNNDRNNGNWGLLYDDEINGYKLAPIYDMGNSFYNKLTDEQIVDKLHNFNENEVSGTRTVYEQEGHVLSSKKMLLYDNEYLKNAIKNLYPKIKKSLIDIKNMINEIPNYCDNYEICSEARKKYYIKTLETRFEKLIEPVYEQYFEQIKELDSDNEVK